jgi:hypothetical protein
MARDIENYPNITPPNTDYPNGRIKDDPGDGTGTPVGEREYGDIQQFFRRLMSLVGITPNDNPDNVTNGFQLVEAAQKLNKFWENTVNTSLCTAGTGAGSYNVLRARDRIIDLTSDPRPDTNPIATFSGESYLPDGFHFYIRNLTGGSISAFFEREATGLDTGENQIILAGSSGNATINFIGQTFRVTKFSDLWLMEEVNS